MSREEKGLLNTVENELKIQQALAAAFTAPKFEPTAQDTSADSITINQFLKESNKPSEYIELQNMIELEEKDSTIPEFSSKNLKGFEMKTNFLDQNKVKENQTIEATKIRIHGSDLNVNVETIPRAKSLINRKSFKFIMYGFLAMPVTVLFLMIWIVISKLE